MEDKKINGNFKIERNRADVRFALPSPIFQILKERSFT